MGAKRAKIANAPELDKGVQKFEKVEKVMKRYPLVRSNFGNNRGDHLFIIYPL